MFLCKLGIHRWHDAVRDGIRVLLEECATCGKERMPAIPMPRHKPN